MLWGEREQSVDFTAARSHSFKLFSTEQSNADHRRLYSSDKIAYLRFRDLGAGALSDSVASVGKSGDQKRCVGASAAPLDNSWPSV